MLFHFVPPYLLGPYKCYANIKGTDETVPMHHFCVSFSKFVLPLQQCKKLNNCPSDSVSVLSHANHTKYQGLF